MLPQLRFNDRGKARITCSCCKKVHQMTTESEPARTRLDHIFTWVMASIRSQGYLGGYLCRKCEKNYNVDTKYVRARCKKVFTPALFEARKNVKITVK